MTDDIRDRALGAFVGLAVGDALGTNLEFTGRDRQPHHTEITGGGPFRLNPGEWTDDTSMAVALATSLIECRGYDARDVMRRFVSWWRDGEYSGAPGRGCFDIGITTRGALEAFLETGRPESGSTGPDTAGNGSIMRLAPAVLFGMPDEKAARSIAERQSLTTHGAPECVEACGYMADLLTMRIRGDVEGLPDGAWRTQGLRRITQGAWRTASRDAIRSTGYVIDTLEAALWADSSSASFEEALVLAVNLAGDADTIGAVTGQIAGARYGLSRIPQRWLNTLHGYKGLVRMAEQLIEALPVKHTEGRLARLLGRRS